MSKHQDLVPAVYISVYELSSDPAQSSIQDNQLKHDINSIKSGLHSSGYKTRLAVILLSDKSISEVPELEDRLTQIRRGTGLDLKTSLFFVPPAVSRAQISSYMNSVLSPLQSLCMEYYRDLTKHARRKKGRGSVPPPTVPPTKGTSQTLSSHGWAIRYEFKQGVFAEFRQEMDVAGRHYTIALEGLLDEEGVFETTSSWSPRWHEARLLADTLAIRILRCLLWSHLTTGAVQSWANYRDRIQDILDQRGKGSNNYGFAAWQARWAKVMAQLIQTADLPGFSTAASLANKAMPDRQVVVSLPPDDPLTDRLPPWHRIHHSGYWFTVSASHTRTRRRLAQEIPEEYRTSPNQSPSTRVAKRTEVYDMYLCPEPHAEIPLPSSSHEGFDYSAEIVDTLNHAVSGFFATGQQRMVNQLKLEIGEELNRADLHAEAFSVLKPLWEGMSWRREVWLDLVARTALALSDSARKVGDNGTVVVAQWELSSGGKPAHGRFYAIFHEADRANSLELSARGRVRLHELCPGRR